MEYDIQIRLKKQNRIESKSAPFRQHWCHRCDAEIVAAGETCSCGYRNDGRLFKHFEVRD